MTVKCKQSKSYSDLIRRRDYSMSEVFLLVMLGKIVILNTGKKNYEN